MIVNTRMALEVELQSAVEQPDLPSSAQVTAWARAAWRDASRDAEVVVRLCGEDESRQLNHEFRGKDKPTNVLSFPYEPHPGIARHHAGDLVICAPVVMHEAVEQGKAVDAHWAHMVIHGMLHLQGYDHLDDTQADEMEDLEAAILTALGFPAPYEHSQ